MLYPTENTYTESLIKGLCDGDYKYKDIYRSTFTIDKILNNYMIIMENYEEHIME